MRYLKRGPRAKWITYLSFGSQVIARLIPLQWGRLIDAWASLLGLVDSVDYEGECGLLLERAALAATGSVAMEFQLAETNMIDWQPLLDNALSLLAAAPPSGLSSGTQPDTWSLLVSFLSRGLLEAIAHNIKTVAVSFPTYPVVLSGGGVFQNRVLLDLVYQQLSELTNSIYCGETIPVNDGGYRCWATLVCHPSA